MRQTCRVSETYRPPLGGSSPTEPVVEPVKRTREHLLVFVLLVGALVAGAASLMEWRDMGARFGMGRVETGWVRADGAMGRGWIALLLAVVIALAGVLIAAGKLRSGKLLAVLGGTGLAVTAVLEWGIGIGGVRWGPGTGLWIELITGVLVVLAVGVLSPAPDPK